MYSRSTGEVNSNRVTSSLLWKWTRLPTHAHEVGALTFEVTDNFGSNVVLPCGAYGPWPCQKSEGMNGQTDWQTQPTSPPVYSLAQQKSWEPWGTFWTWSDLSITAIAAWQRERGGERKWPTNHPLRSEFNQTNTCTILRASLGDCWEMERGTYGPFWALSHYTANLSRHCKPFSFFVG